MSTEVKMPSGCIPANRAKPETPVPVPISTTALAETVRASKVSIAAVPRPSGMTPRSAALSRAEVAASGSGRNVSAYAQEAALGADLAAVLLAGRFTAVSLLGGSGATPPCSPPPERCRPAFAPPVVPTPRRGHREGVHRVDLRGSAGMDLGVDGVGHRSSAKGGQGRAR